jgi:FdhE protein
MTDQQALSGGADLGPIPYLRLPSPGSIFARRAERFAALAQGHTLSEYLELLSRLAAAQAAASTTVQLALDTEHIRHERPLDAAAHRRAPEWRDALSVILAELSTVDLPDEGRSALELLAALPPPELEALADRLLANAVLGTDLAAGPFAAAALQVYFTALAAQLPADAVARAPDGCPVCGSLPVTGLVLGDDKLRYLVCSLCATQWHHTRVQCAACHQGQGLRYFSLEGRTPGGGDGRAPSGASGEKGTPPRPRVAPSARAEACPSCKTYTKLFYVEADPRLEPFADDVATLSLDLLMAEEGWARHGVNLFLLAGEERAPAPEHP